MSETSIPASRNQERLWLLSEHDNKSEVYNMPLLLELNEVLDPDRLEAALRSLLNQEATLRKYFELKNNSLWQNTAQSVNLTLNRVSVSSREEFEKLAPLIMSEKLDIYTPPVFKPYHFTIGETHTVLLFIFHHSLSDGYSTSFFLKQLAQAFRKEAAYSDPISQNKHQEITLTQPKSAVCDYWKQYLGETDSKLWLPGRKKAHSSDNVSAAGSIVTVFTEEDSNRFLQRTQALRVTENSTLMALIAAAIYRCSGKHDFLLGMADSFRESDQSWNEHGFFVNTLPVRCNLKDHRCFDSLAKSINTDSMQHREYNNIDFQDILDLVNTSRSSESRPLIQVMVSNNLSLDADIELDGISGVVMNPHSLYAKFDITFYLFKVKGCYKFQIEYDKDLYSHELVSSFASKLEKLFSCFIEDPKALVGKCDVLSVTERDLIVDWGKGEAKGFDTNKTLLEDIRSSVLTCPHKVSIKFSDGEMTYREMWDKASVFCSFLESRLGQHSDQPSLIPIFMERGWRQLIAIIGTLKAGHSYLPIDNKTPPSGLKEILGICESTILITEKGQFCDHILDIQEHVSIEDFDEIYSTYKSSETSSMDFVRRDSNSLAYVIFTSGSTGKPKGVMISHQSALNTIYDINGIIHAKQSDIAISISSSSFDLSVYDYFGVLGFGGTLVLLDSDKENDPQHWYEMSLKNNVSIWNSVPAQFQMIIDYCGALDTPPLLDMREVLLSGDWIPTSLPSSSIELFPNINLLSLGGATEASIWSIAHPIDRSRKFDSKIPYGKALSNQSFYVLNEYGQLNPIGIPGELFIGGNGVAQGYFKDIDRTQASFTYHSELKEVLYHTGDFGYMNELGEIELGGRLDNQVKINGHRIELGEIEAVINSYADIKRSVVIPTLNNANGQKVLIAYFDTINALSIDVSKLKAFLHKKLQTYKVPLLRQIDKFELTNNGKVDRKSFPTEVSLNVKSNASKQGLSIKESFILELFCSLTAQEDVEVNDSFFDIGGNSMLSVKVIVAVKDKFGLKLSLSDIYQHSTVAKLARLVEQVGDGDLVKEPESSCINVNGRATNKVNLVLIHAVDGETYVYDHLIHLLGEHANIFSISASKSIIESVGSMSELAKAYLESILSELEGSSFIVGGWSFGGALAYELASQAMSRQLNFEGVFCIDSYVPVIENSQINVFDVKLMMEELEGKGLFLEGVFDKKIAEQCCKLLAHYSRSEYSGRGLSIVARDGGLQYKKNRIFGAEIVSVGNREEEILGFDHFNIMALSGSKKVAQLLASFFNLKTSLKSSSFILLEV